MFCKWYQQYKDLTFPTRPEGENGPPSHSGLHPSSDLMLGLALYHIEVESKSYHSAKCQLTLQ